MNPFLEQARQLVKECLTTQNPYLDLGNCGLTDLGQLPELFECTHLETLILSNTWYDFVEKKKKQSQNRGPHNQITKLTNGFLHLQNLQTLKMGGYHYNFGFIYYTNKWHIADYELLGYLTKLKVLDISYTGISDISPLKALNQLNALVLTGNGISDISPLKAVNLLNALDLSYTRISDISPLKALRQLNTLNLSENKISDISPLKALHQLNALVLTGNGISDISPLKQLNQLNTLDLSENKISDISPLKALNQLNALVLSYTRISDISPLKAVNQLNALDLSGNGISDISPLKAVNQLNALVLSGNGISDISPLKALNQLNTLNLSENKISDIRPLKALNQLNALVLSGNGISDISPLKQLNQLNALDLSENKISDISPLKALNQLNSLDLSYTRISDISPLKALNQLNALVLTGNGISDISPLKQLKQLNALDLTGNGISDISPLKAVNQLNALVLSDNQISDISPLKALNQLNALDLSYTGISDISPLKQLKQLNALDLYNNEISDISPLEALNQLNALVLTGNGISDISPLKALNQLNSLVLSDNQISDISPLKALNQLNALDLSDNQISFIPEFIFHLNPWERIVETLLKNNPVANPPIEKIRQGKKAVLDWFKAEKEKFKEIKIILIGEPEAGKTSLLKRLHNNEFKEGEPQTDGINIVPIDFAEAATFKNQKELHGIQGRFWDFGGQEIMSATHKLFLSERSVYILVLKARNDKTIEKQVRDGVADIISKGEDSPIIVVANKMDVNPSFQFVNTYALTNEFPQIKGFLRISCATGKNLEDLKNKLQEVIPQAGYFNSEVDICDINLKDEILKITGEEDYLNEKEFRRLCKKVGLQSEQTQDIAIDFLDKLGLALHFNEIDFSKFFVLDPNWITTGIYRIITSKKAAGQQGIVKQGDLNYILNKEQQKTGNSYRPFQQKEYTYTLAEERTFIKEVLLAYKLAFTIRNKKEIRISTLLKANPEDDEFTSFYKEKTLDFFYTYTFLPPNIIPQLLADIDKDYLKDCWKTGFLLEFKDTTALVEAIKDEIRIRVKGSEPMAVRDLMIYLRALMDNINKVSKYPPDKVIPLPGTKEATVKYEVLINRLKKDKKDYFLDEDTDDEKAFIISELLDGMPTEVDIAHRLEKMERNQIKMLRNQQDFKNDINALKKELLLEFKNLTENQQNVLVKEITSYLNKAIEAQLIVMNQKNKKLLEIFNTEKDNFELKLKYSFPLLKLLTGLDVEASFDVKNWAQTLYEKHKIDIYKLFGYL
jgi:small GTP-binding protein